jgi:hypothetical protein
MYFTDAPPAYTVPYYDHIPYRPRGVIVSTAIDTEPLPTVQSLAYVCAAAPEWHSNQADPINCGRGFVIFSSVDATLNIRVAPIIGTGCNDPDFLTCTPFYPLALPLRAGRNNFIWCGDTHIYLARHDQLMSPDSHLATDYGSILFFPTHPLGVITNHVFDGRQYRALPLQLYPPTQPDLMMLSACSAIQPPRFTFYLPPGTANNLSNLLRESHNSLDMRTYSFSQGYTVRLLHRVLPIATTPPRCLCGHNYTPGDEDYTTGGPPLNQ